MESLKESIKAVLSVQNHERAITEFAEKSYKEHFKDKKPTYDGSWRVYKGYEIISDSMLKVCYSYGYADMEFDDFFTVEIE